jgi:hypothetical protein
MSNVDDKLRRGYDLAARAGGDPDALGVALLALHGALEEHLDETLQRLPEVLPEDRAQIGQPGYGWSTRAALAQRYGLITREQRQAILDANRQRQEFAHGGVFAGRQRELENYAGLVAELVGRRPTAARPVARPAPRPAARYEQAPVAGSRPARPPASEGTTIGGTAWNQRAQVRSTRRKDLLPDSLPVRGLIGALGVLILLFMVWRLLSGAPAETDVPVADRPLSQQITPAPTTPPVTPSPVVRQGRIVGLGGAVGFMHEPAGFTTPTLPRPLTEGTVVTLLDQPAVEAEGATWIKISYGGYEGWVPVNNVAEGAGEPAPSPAAAP